ncbi:MAG: tyrosine-protein phosphatase [Myxococcales bacterium]|jgi:protein-tyrosine phosphatase|nr:MAG: tyrosine-protein phosphatase [Myxococcales bacterium]
MVARPSEPIALEGAVNFRDLGGHPTLGGRRVVRGRAYRADALHRLGATDAPVLDPLGIEIVFDLRSRTELENDGVGEFVSARRHVHVPLVQVSLSPFDAELDWLQMNLQERYVEMLQQGGGTICRVVEWLAEPGAGACVFHCTGGKDRTGVVAAVILRALGVPDEEVVADYAVSERHLRTILQSYRGELESRGLDDEAIAYLTSSPPERMRHTLAELDRRWGSTLGYLESIGVGCATVDAMRRSLLTD